jgi:hypothetical protein
MPPGVSPGPGSPLGTAARAVAWLAGAILIAAGAAGMVAGADHPPGDATRPELTWRADAALAVALAELRVPFAGLSDQVSALAGVARDALVDTVARRDDLVATDLQRGKDLAASISLHSEEVRRLLAGLPGVEHPELLGATSQRRLAAARAALSAVQPLPASWDLLAGSTLPPLKAARLIEEHDQATFGATQQGVAGHFQLALQALTRASGVRDEIQALRDQLAPGADVSTLCAWLEVAGTYDRALEALYGELAASGGKMTAAAKAALSEVERAQARLPADTRALTVIMGELAQGGLDQAAIAIEQARGALAAAVAALD